MDSDTQQVAPEKVYIAVFATYLLDGTVIPRSFEWEDGNRYDIKRVIHMQSLSSLRHGGKGIRYKVRIKNRDTYIFLEEGHGGVRRFYVERRLN